MPLQDIFWTTLMFAGFAISIWLVFVVLRDLWVDLGDGRRRLHAAARASSA